MINTIAGAINFANKTKKPLFIEIKNFRFIEHCGPNNDDHLKYRSPNEIQFWNKNDALKILERYLFKKNKKLIGKKYLNTFNNKINNIFLKIYSKKNINKLDLQKIVYKNDKI